MISLGAKFADYGLTGGFAVCGQAALLSWLAPGTTHSIIECVTKALGTFFQELPPGLITPVSAFLTAVAIISIFFLGLVLELIGSVAVFWELRVFKQHLEYHRPWLSSLLADYGSATVKDADRIVDEFGDPFKKELLDSFRGLAFWKRSVRERAKKNRGRFGKRRRLLKPFARVESLLLSYVLAADSVPRLDLLRDHLQLCRISRAVSAVLYLFSFEIFIWMANLWQIDMANYAESEIFKMFLGFILLPVVLGWGLTVLAMFLPTRAYGRFSNDLFFNVLILSRKLDKDSRGQTSKESGALRQDSDNG